MKYFGVILLLLFIVAAAIIPRHRVDGTDSVDPPALEAVRQFLPDAASLDFLPETETFRVRDQDGGLSGFVVVSSPHMDSIIGYAGPTPVMIALNADGRIAGIALLQHSETPGFIRQLKGAGFFKRWDGLSVDEAAVHEVDAVSGATQSSAAIAATVRERLTLLADGFDGARMAAHGTVRFAFPDGVMLFVVIGAVLMHLRSARLATQGWWSRLRYLWPAVSFLLLGIYGASMFSLALLDGWVRTGRIHGGVGIIVIVFVAVGWTLFAGKNIYCASMCPFGALQELSFRFSPLQYRLPAVVRRRLRYVRYVLLCLTSCYIIFRIGVPPDLQEPFSAFRPRAAGLPAIGLALLALLTSIAGERRPWCNFGCSSGALFDLLRKTAP